MESARAKTYRLAILAGACLAALAVITTLAGHRFVQNRQADGERWRAPSIKLAKLGRLAQLRTQNQALFESGNIGRIERLDARRVVLNLRSDNDDALPKYWRQWFYLELTDLPTGKPVQIDVRGAGQWSYYLPFYSYDNKQWHQFDRKSVSKPSRYALRIRHQFKQERVWLARYVPYPYSKLQSYLETLRARPGVTLGDLGETPEGRKIPLVTITNPKVKDKIARVVMHARTHPGEVGSSFLLEGFLDFVTGPSAEARRLRDKLVFTVVPMLNVDGVVAGNNRVTPYGVNLEGKWYSQPEDPLQLDAARAPPEVRLMHRLVTDLLKEPVPVTMALNLHSSAGEPEDNVFFFPHFGPRAKGYTEAEANLFGMQRRFIDLFSSTHGKQWFNEPAKDGTRSFLTKSVPESWWWRNYQDKVMALSIESTYGLAGGTKRWVKPADMRKMGVSMAKAILRYHDGEAKRLAKALAH